MDRRDQEGHGCCLLEKVLCISLAVLVLLLMFWSICSVTFVFLWWEIQFNWKTQIVQDRVPLGSKDLFISCVRFLWHDRCTFGGVSGERTGFEFKSSFDQKIFYVRWKLLSIWGIIDALYYIQNISALLILSGLDSCATIAVATILTCCRSEVILSIPYTVNFTSWPSL